MHIWFSPTLDETVHVSISPRDASIVLYFTATLSSDDHAVLTKDSAKVQLWSDIPLGVEWSESDFQDLDPPEAVRDSRVVSLRRSTGTGLEARDPQRERTLFLKLLVPQARVGQQYSFTYRLLFPSGEIEWLGRFGENGTIVVDLQNRTDVILGEEWTRNDSGYEWNTGGKFVDGLEVARLARPSDHVVWAIGEEASFSGMNAFLVFLVPRAGFPLATMNLASLYAISTTSDLTITVLSSGAITARGVGSLTLCTHGARQLSDRAFIDNVMSPFSLDNRRCVTLVEDNSYILLTPPNSAWGHSAKISLLPLHQSHTYYRIRIGLDALTAYLPGIDGYFLSSPLDPEVHLFIDKTRDGRPITFIVDPSGGEFTLSPAYDLAGGKCQVSLLTPYDLLRYSSQEEADALPTPPPSPRLDPAVRCSRESRMSSIRPLANIRETLPEAKPKSTQLTAFRPLLLGFWAFKFIFTTMAVLLHRLVFSWLKLSGPGSRNGSAISKSHKAVNKMELNNRHIETELSPNIPVPIAAEDCTNNLNTHTINSSPMELLVETKGLVKIVAHSVIDATSLLERFVIEVNGEKAVISTTHIQVDIYLFELDAGDGGLVKLTLLEV